MTERAQLGWLGPRGVVCGAIPVDDWFSPYCICRRCANRSPDEARTSGGVRAQLGVRLARACASEAATRSSLEIINLCDLLFGRVGYIVCTTCLEAPPCVSSCLWMMPLFAFPAPGPACLTTISSVPVESSTRDYGKLETLTVGVAGGRLSWPRI